MLSEAAICAGAAERGCERVVQALSSVTAGISSVTAGPIRVLRHGEPEWFDQVQWGEDRSAGARRGDGGGVSRPGGSGEDGLDEDAEAT